ncbi:MAG: phosphotransferase [Chromatiales bacterium]|nr:phosphotransferase [Chromatiales bacterium]
MADNCSDRNEARAAFLACCGWGEAIVTPLPADASFRRYFRLQKNGTTRLLMDAPPPEDVHPFVLVGEHLRKGGLSAPRIDHADQAAGFLLLEDFGDATFTNLLAHGKSERQLLEMAVDTLVHLHEWPGATDIPLPPYDTETLLREAALFPDWFMLHRRNRACSAPAREAYIAAWRGVFDALPPVTPMLVLRDYHVDNLMLLDGREGVDACGLLDFQDALIGPAAYDLVSLLEDARRAIDAELKAHLFSRYVASTSTSNPELLDAYCAVLGAQRHAKVAGIFVRLSVRDGKPHYLKHIPHVLAMLADRLAHPLLAEVRQWFARHSPMSGAQ